MNLREELSSGRAQHLSVAGRNFVETLAGLQESAKKLRATLADLDRRAREHPNVPVTLGTLGAVAESVNIAMGHVEGIIMVLAMYPPK